MGALSPFPYVHDLAEHVSKSLALAKEKNSGKLPKVMVMGAKGLFCHISHTHLHIYTNIISILNETL